MELLKKVTAAAHTLGAIILGLMFISIVAQVIVRLLGGCMVWVEELSGYGAVWVTYLGIAYALRQGRHVRVDLLTRQVSPKMQAIMRGLGDIACVIFSIILTWKAIYLVGVSLQVQRLTPLLGLPVYWLQIVLPVGFILFGLESLADSILAVRAFKNETASGEVTAFTKPPARPETLKE